MYSHISKCFEGFVTAARFSTAASLVFLPFWVVIRFSSVSDYDSTKHHNYDSRKHHKEIMKLEKKSYGSEGNREG
ncbi:hypothetical protein C1H46_020373 [Malus baccata]|uniref:Transmembrane protein n=1 Tax=Malus baccata TaxID=106549 RepID=A0A540M5L4_MALBA|nr:hypothetical protein C1H46_020373 [Malus baccata]